MRIEAWLRAAALVLLCLTLGCAVIKPSYRVNEETPIDWGLAGAFEAGITVADFWADNQTWGRYAADRMQAALLEAGAFRRVVRMSVEPTPYVLTGEVEHLYYGGTHSPTSVRLTMRVISADDGRTLFLRRAAIQYSREGVHLTRFTRIDPAAPYPEELLVPLMQRTAGDIAARTRQPVHKCP